MPFQFCCEAIVIFLGDDDGHELQTDTMNDNHYNACDRLYKTQRRGGADVIHCITQWRAKRMQEKEVHGTTTAMLVMFAELLRLVRGRRPL